MSDQLRDENIHWLSDLIFQFLKTDDFAKTQDNDVKVHAVAMTLFRYIYFHSLDGTKERNLDVITSWMRDGIENWKPEKEIKNQ